MSRRRPSFTAAFVNGAPDTLLLHDSSAFPDQMMHPEIEIVPRASHGRGADRLRAGSLASAGY
jgi:hypothetical protein